MLVFFLLFNFNLTTLIVICIKILNLIIIKRITLIQFVTLGSH